MKIIGPSFILYFNIRYLCQYSTCKKMPAYKTHFLDPVYHVCWVVEAKFPSFKNQSTSWPQTYCIGILEGGPNTLTFSYSSFSWCHTWFLHWLKNILDTPPPCVLVDSPLVLLWGHFKAEIGILLAANRDKVLVLLEIGILLGFRGRLIGLLSVLGNL